MSDAAEIADSEVDEGRYLPRPRKRSLLLAIAIVWLPCTLPLFGIVNDSSHALQTYAMCFVAVPGMIVPTILQLDDFAFGLVAFVATMLIFGSMYIVQRWSPAPFMQIMSAAAVVLLSFAAVGLGHAFRA